MPRIQLLTRVYHDIRSELCSNFISIGCAGRRPVATITGGQHPPARPLLAAVKMVMRATRFVRYNRAATVFIGAIYVDIPQ
jgi:hypothetical protein